MSLLPRPLRRPVAWAAISAGALFVALILPPSVPAGVFWAAIAVSCAAAALWGLCVAEGQ